MANPYHHMARHTGQTKLKAIHNHKHGGKVHGDAAQDRAIKKMIHEHEHKVHGRKKGGRLDHGHRKVKISIEKSAPGGMPDTGAAPPAPTMMPPPGMSAGPMPGGPPAGPMGMQKRGGRVKHRAKGGRIKPQRESVMDDKEQRHFLHMRRKGGRVYDESTKANLKDWAGYASKNSFKGRASGGRIGKYPLHKGGAGSGEGRLSLTRAEKKSYP